MTFYSSHKGNKKSHLISDIVDTLPKWLRWVILLPCSIFAYGAVYSIAFVLQKNVLTSGSDQDDLFSVPTAIKIAGIIAAFFGSVVFIKCSYLVAPKYKKGASLTLLIFLLLIAASQISEAIHLVQYKFYHFYYFYLIKYLAMSIGAISGWALLPSKQDILNGRLQEYWEKIVASRNYLPKYSYEKAEKAYKYCCEDISQVNTMYPELSRKERENKRQQYFNRFERDISEIYGRE
jgi:hypothetical protein